MYLKKNRSIGKRKTEESKTMKLLDTSRYIRDALQIKWHRDKINESKDTEVDYFQLEIVRKLTISVTYETRLST